MKNKITLFLAALIMSITSLMAQSPNMINYQGVARNAVGNPIANQNIKVRFKIRSNTPTGTAQYSETRTLTTTATGLFNAQIGSTGATATTGNMTAIKWDNGAKYLQVEMDATGGNNFKDMGTQQLVSVPYAQLANQADGLSSTAKVLPSQIATTGATPGQVLQFNGTAWAPGVVQGGGSLSLPYITNDANLISFGIINKSALGGTAIYGQSTTNSNTATGVKGEVTKANGTGVYGKAAGSAAIGVLGENTTGYGVKGISSSTSSSGAGVYGINNGTSGNGVSGQADFINGVGVLGSSTTGIGLKGYSNSNFGVFGSTLTGTALKGFSYQGYGLDVDGKVKIAGGNTNPGAGKVLTSDASGNATWQPTATAPKIAFSAHNPTNVNYASGGTAQVAFITEEYDSGNNFDINTDIFTAPVNGVYHFDGSTTIYMGSNTSNMANPTISLVIKRNGVETYFRQSRGSVESTAFGSSTTLTISCDASLQTGDQVYLKVYQYNSSGDPASTTFFVNSAHFFDGHIVFPY